MNTPRTRAARSADADASVTTLRGVYMIPINRHCSHQEKQEHEEISDRRTRASRPDPTRGGIEAWRAGRRS